MRKDDLYALIDNMSDDEVKALLDEFSKYEDEHAVQTFVSIAYSREDKSNVELRKVSFCKFRQTRLRKAIYRIRENLYPLEPKTLLPNQKSFWMDELKAVFWEALMIEELFGFHVDLNGEDIYPKETAEIFSRHSLAKAAEIRRKYGSDERIMDKNDKDREDSEQSESYIASRIEYIRSKIDAIRDSESVASKKRQYDFAQTRGIGMLSKSSRERESVKAVIAELESLRTW